MAECEDQDLADEPAKLPEEEDFQCTVDDAIRFLVNSFLETQHRRKLHEILACKWDRCQSAQAAVKLLKKNGVELSSEEEAHLGSLSDTECVEALVQKIPEQSSDEFQGFFLELQLLVSFAMRIRQGLEESHPEEVCQALDDVDSTEVTLPAGVEVMNLGQQHKAWIQDSQHRLSLLVRGQEEAMAAKKKWAAANAILHNALVSQNEKAKRVLGTFLHTSTTAMLKSIVASWLCIMRREKMEKAVHQEYQDKLERMQKHLARCRQDQLTQVRNLFMRKCADGLFRMKRELFDLWREEVEESKIDKDIFYEAKKVESKLAALKETQASRMTCIIESVAANANTCLVAALIRAWQGEVSKSKQDLELKKWLQATERHVKQRRQANKNLCLVNCDRLAKQFDLALLSLTLRSWVQTYQEAKQSGLMLDRLSSAQQQLSHFAAKNALAARQCMIKAAEILDEDLSLRCFQAWRMDQKMSGISAQHSTKIDGKREQLQQVQKMFRTFAVSLESQTSEMKKEARKERQQRRAVTLHKMDTGSVSLPDIHQPRPGEDAPKEPQGTAVA